MKKWIITVLACALTVVLLIGTVSAVATPNRGSPNPITTTTYKPYVQCQPSFNDNGYHAAQGYYFILELTADGLLHDGGEHYTPWGTNINDSRILRAESNFSKIYGGNVHFSYTFTWVPHGSTTWPVSVPGDSEIE